MSEIIDFCLNKVLYLLTYKDIEVTEQLVSFLLLHPAPLIYFCVQFVIILKSFFKKVKNLHSCKAIKVTAQLVYLLPILIFAFFVL